MITAMQEMQKFINAFEDEPINPIFLRLRAEQLLQKEKEQIVEAYNSSINTIMLLPSGIKSQKGNAEDYYNRTYNQDRIRITETKKYIEGIGINK
jgi:hypothetical protein